MSPGAHAGAALLFVVCLASAACATRAVPGPAGRAVVADEQRRVVADEQRRAAALEEQGRLRSALDHLDVASTLDPDEPAVRQARQRLQQRIEREVEEALRQGREAVDRGEIFEARRYFLAALALDPGNESAFDALRSRIPDTRWVVHTVRRGDTLVGLAERYYGDRAGADAIGQLNRLPVTARLNPGTTLRIPEVPGLAFIVTDPRFRPREEPREPHPLLVEARDAFERGDYAQAGLSVDRLLASQPQNADGLDLKKALLYNIGRSQLEQQRWEESYQTLNQLARLTPSYLDARVLLRQARDRLIQQHYSQGLRLFREEKLEEAIVEWRIVVELDPQHANARRNLEQAERLLKALEERRKRP